MTSDCQLLANRQTAAEVAVRAVRLAHYGPAATPCGTGWRQ